MEWSSFTTDSNTDKGWYRICGSGGIFTASYEEYDVGLVWRSDRFRTLEQAERACERHAAWLEHRAKQGE